MFNNKNQHGFSVIELAVVIVIISILLAVAVPSYLRWLPNNNLKSSVKGLKGHLQMAKLEASKRNNPVTVAFTSGTYLLQGKVGGYVVFVDANSNGAIDAGEERIQQVQMTDLISLVSAAPAFVRFNSRGLPHMAGLVEIRNEEFFGRLVWSIAGRIRLERKPDGGTYAAWN